MRTPPQLGPALLLLLTGCAGISDTAPSLEPRAIEKRDDAEPVVVPAVIQPDPALDREIAARAEPLRKAGLAFDAAASAAERAIARAGRAAVGSDAWIAGQAAISELGAARATSESALSDLEQLAIARASAGQPPYPALDAAIAAGSRQVGAANAAFARLQRRLAMP